MRKISALVLGVVCFASITALPQPAEASFPFGGAIQQILFCFNDGARWVSLGPPRGGSFIWFPSTRTYKFGPPSHGGQWLLGLASAPHFCVWSIQPIQITAGSVINMMGSSQ